MSTYSFKTPLRGEEQRRLVPRLDHLRRAVSAAVTFAALAFVWVTTDSRADDLFGAPSASRPNPNPQLSTNLATADEIFSRHLHGIGGEAALRQAKHLAMKGAIEIPALTDTAPVEFRVQAPDRFFCRFKFHYAFFHFLRVPFVGKREAECGYDGTNGWIVGLEKKTEPLPGINEAFFRGMLDKFTPLWLGRQFALARTLDVGPWAGRDCYRVLVVFPNGNHAFEYYDLKRGLLTGAIYPFETDNAVVNVAMTYSGFRRIEGGLLAPFRIDLAVGEQRYTLCAEEIHAGAAGRPVPASKYRGAPLRHAALQAAAPPATAVIDRYLAALGGPEALRRHTATHCVGQYQVSGPHGFTNAIELFSAVSNRFFVKLQTPHGLHRQGCDGRNYWRSTGSEIWFADGKELEQKLAQRDFLADLHDPNGYRSIENLGPIRFQGKECYQVLLVRKSGEVFFEFYDIETGLLHGRRSTNEESGGWVWLTEVFVDYQRFGDWLLPTRRMIYPGGGRNVLTISAVEWDQVPDNVFELPPEAKAAWERKNAAP